MAKKNTTIRQTLGGSLTCPKCNTKTHEKTCPSCNYEFSNKDLMNESKNLMIWSLVMVGVGIIIGAIMGMFSSDPSEAGYSIGKNLGFFGAVLGFTAIFCIFAMPIYFLIGLFSFLKLRSQIEKTN